MPYCTPSNTLRSVRLLPLQMKGLSLIEFLLVLSLIVVIGLFGVPSWYAVYRTTQIQSMVVDIKAAIQCAKVQAMIYHQPIELSPLFDSKDWSKGIALRLNDRILQSWSWSVQGVSLTWRGFQSSSGLYFSSDSASSAVNGVFLIQSDHDKIKLVVNRLARVTQ